MEMSSVGGMGGDGGHGSPRGELRPLHARGADAARVVVAVAVRVVGVVALASRAIAPGATGRAMWRRMRPSVAGQHLQPRVWVNLHVIEELLALFPQHRQVLHLHPLVYGHAVLEHHQPPSLQDAPHEFV